MFPLIKKRMLPEEGKYRLRYQRDTHLKQWSHHISSAIYLY